jgi:hypothetical protein
MNLEVYLEKLKNCADDDIPVILNGKKIEGNRFTAEWGISDNWPIYIQTDVEKMIEDLQKKGIFTFLRTERCDGKKRHHLNYNLGTVFMQIIEGTTGLAGLDEIEEKLSETKKEYNCMLMLHPYQRNKKIENISDMKAISLAVIDLGKYFQEEKIPAFFPRTIGKEPFELKLDLGKEYSKMVKYDPEEIKR